MGQNPNAGETVEVVSLFPVLAIVRVTVPNILDQLIEDHIDRDHGRQIVQEISAYLLRTYEIDGLLISSESPFPILSGSDTREAFIACALQSGVSEEKAVEFIDGLLRFLSEEVGRMNEARTMVSVDSLGFWRLGSEGIAYFTQRKLRNGVPN